jgi:hypothetical protein
VGQTIDLNGHTFEVIGIAPQTFQSAVWGEMPDVFVPMSMLDVVIPGKGKRLSDHTDRWMNVIGRLHEGETSEQAEAGVVLLMGLVGLAAALVQRDGPRACNRWRRCAANRQVSCGLIYPYVARPLKRIFRTFGAASNKKLRTNLCQCRAVLKSENFEYAVRLLYLIRIRAQAPCT